MLLINTSMIIVINLILLLSLFQKNQTKGKEGKITKRQHSLQEKR